MRWAMHQLIIHQRFILLAQKIIVNIILALFLCIIENNSACFLRYFLSTM